MFFVYRGIENKILYYVIGVFKWCLMPMSLLMSVSNLMLVTVLRYYAAKRPFKYQSFTNGFITKICLLQWVLVTLFPIIKFSLSYRLNEEISEDPGIFLHIFIFLAATGLAATYVFIFRAIRSRKVGGESNSQSHGKTREKHLQLLCLPYLLLLSVGYLIQDGKFIQCKQGIRIIKYHLFLQLLCSQTLS